jgi:HEAT repeat protein
MEEIMNETLNQKVLVVFEQIRWAEDSSLLMQELATGIYGDPFRCLMIYMQSSDVYERTYAFDILMQFDIDRAIPIVLPLMNESDRQFSLCYWIAQLGGPSSAIEPVIHILQTGIDAGTRVMAATALAQIGDERAIQALKIAMQHDFTLDSGGHSVNSVAPDAIHAIRTRFGA